MKKLNLKSILIYGALIAIVVVTVVTLRSNKDKATNQVFHFDKAEVMKVRTQLIQQETIPDEREFSGTFEPNKESKISAEVQGKINSILVDVGSLVRKNQPIVQLDQSLLQLQLETINIQINSLEVDRARFEILSKAEAIQGVQLEKVVVGLQTARSQRATIVKQIEKTTIRAPFDGIVTAKLNEEGGFAAPGVPLLQITDIHQLKFTIQVPENELRLFQMDEVYSIQNTVYPELNLKGKTILIGSKGNMGSSFPIQFIVQNTSDLKVKSGMFGRVMISKAGTKPGFSIPSSSIQNKGSQSNVYVVKNNKARLVPINIEKRQQNKVLVSGDLQVGDTLITQGFITLFDGANVSLK